jgi:streptomycin 6-kinase
MPSQWGNTNMALPIRLRSCLSAWGLHAVSRLEGGFRSAVFACTTSTGKEVVVKLAATADEARAEAAALSVWDGTGATIHLIAADFPHAALLLDRVRPATPLPSHGDQVAIAVAADLLRRLHATPAGSFPFPALEQIYARMERRSRADAAYEQRASGDPTRGVAGLQRLDAARSAAQQLCATTERRVLLHGDFLDKNLLWDGAGYVAIDPIPCIGDACSDVGFFAAGRPPATAILSRAVAIATRLGLNSPRAQRWALIWTVLQACQAWRRDQADLDALMSSDAVALLHEEG